MKNLFLIMLMVLFSCNSESNNEETNIESEVQFFVLDDENNDLLNPNGQNSINLENVKVFEIIDGQEVEVNNPNSDSPRGFVLLEPEGIYDKYRLALGLNIKETSNPTTTIIKWSTTDVDRFKAEFNRGNNFIICTKIWLNDKTVWDNNGVRFIEITK